MANIVTATSMPPQVQQTFALKLLSTPTPNYIYKYVADPELLPRHGGDTLRFSRYNPLPAALVPLGTSGATPPPTDLDRVDIDMRVSWYGQFIYLNEQVQLSNQDSVLNAAAKRLGSSLRLTEDNLMRNMLLSSATRMWCTNGIDGDSPTELTSNDINKAIRSLLSANAWMIQDIVGAEDLYGTSPIRSSYMALAHTDLQADLEAVQGFKPTSEYPSPQSVLRTEWGAVRNLRFHLSTEGAIIKNSSSINGADVYAVTFAGLEAAACVKQDGASARFIYLPPEIVGGPLAQNCSVAWKSAMAFGIKNESWIGNLMCTKNL